MSTIYSVDTDELRLNFILKRHVDFLQSYMLTNEIVLLYFVMDMFVILWFTPIEYIWSQGERQTFAITWIVTDTFDGNQ